MVTFVLYTQLEVFFFLCYNPIILLNKSLKLIKSNQTQSVLTTSVTNTPYFILFFILFFFIKSNSVIILSLFTFSIIYLFKVSQLLEKVTNTITSNNIVYLVLPTFVSFLYLLIFVKSLLTFFFFIEIYGVLYYFLFLTNYQFTNQTILKYKNGLLFLLWNNFLTTLFLGLGCLFLAKNSGSTAFSELIFLEIDNKSIYFFLIGLFWKLGLPLFHFFKLEVYKYLLKENVFLFSIITTLFNLIIFYVFISEPTLFSCVYTHNLLVLAGVFTIVLTVVNLKLTSFLQFFALSGVFTLMTVLTVFLI
jgi:hypothetical protein